MKVKFNYFLKIKSLMGKEFDEFEINESSTIKDIILNNIPSDKLEKINLSELMVICDGKNVESLDTVVEEDVVFSICPKIYGG
jgi:hypothetical protein